MEVAGSGVFGRGSCVLFGDGAADGEGIAAGLSVWLYAAAGAEQQAKKAQPCLHRNRKLSLPPRQPRRLSQALLALLALPHESSAAAERPACSPSITSHPCELVSLPRSANCCPSSTASQPALARAASPSLRCRAVVRAAWSLLLLWWQDGAAFLSTRYSWLAAIGRDESSHMRPHRTVQPPPSHTRLAAQIAQPSF